MRSRVLSSSAPSMASTASTMTSETCSVFFARSSFISGGSTLTRPSEQPSALALEHPQLDAQPAARKRMPGHRVAEPRCQAKVGDQDPGAPTAAALLDEPSQCLIDRAKRARITDAPAIRRVREKEALAARPAQRLE